VRSSARLAHGGRALARACGTEAREEASRASREARAARLSLQKGAGDATGQPRGKKTRQWWPRPRARGVL
jgi:hypothetical protein